MIQVFVILKLCFLAISLFINIPMMPLSKSALIVMPLCISTFSIPMSNHTSLRILNVLLMSLSFFSFIAMLFNSLSYALLCCAFASLGCTASFLFLHSHHFCLFEIILYFPLHNTPFFYTYVAINSPYTTLAQIDMPHLGCLLHNAPVSSVVRHVPDFSCPLAMLLMTWPYMLPLLSLFFSFSFLFSALLP